MNFLAKWYDTWAVAIDERLNPCPEWTRGWEPDFFEYINEGWLDMYYEPQEEPTIEEYIKDFINSTPYYNEKYYDEV